MLRSTFPIFVVALVVYASGCGSCDRRSDAPAEEKTAEPVARPNVPLGVVEGVIRLAEGVELPKYSRADLGENARANRASVCPPPRETELTPVHRGEGGALSGALVSMTGFSQSPAHEPKEHVIEIVHCGLEPRLVAATRGDRLTIVNKTAHPFLPAFGREPFSDALLENQQRTIELDRGGVVPLRCQFGSACGRTDVVVLYHPVHAISDGEGRFRIENVPAGEKLTVHAWHPLFEEAAREVTVAAGQSITVELAMRPGAPQGEGQPRQGSSDDSAPKQEAESAPSESDEP